jgi:hypothetical protein
MYHRVRVSFFLHSDPFVEHCLGLFGRTRHFYWKLLYLFSYRRESFSCGVEWMDVRLV